MESPPSWHGIPESVPLHDGISAGAWFAGVLLTLLTCGLAFPVFAWDWWTRANAIDRDGVRSHRGLLRWSELEDASVRTTDTTRKKRVTATVSMIHLRFGSRTIVVGPWGAPDPELVIRAVSAGAGRRLEVPPPSGNVR